MARLLEIAISNALVAGILAALAWGALRLLGRAALAHGLWLLALVKLLTPPIVTIPIPVLRAEIGEVRAECGGQRHEETWRQGVGPTHENTGARSDGGNEPRGSERIMPVEVDRSQIVPLGKSAAPGRETLFQTALSRWPTARWEWAGACVWLAGAIVAATGIALRARSLNRLLALAGEADAPTIDLARRAARRLGLSRLPRIVLTPGPLSPMLWALAARTTLVLPRELWQRLDESRRLAILTHELAHFGRRDHLVRWLEAAAAIVYWWNPAVWAGIRGLRQAEELCCDAWVVRAWPRHSKSYATALVDTLDFVSEFGVRAPLGASGAAHVSMTQLKRRIIMIMKASIRPSLSAGAKIAILALGLLLVPALPRLTAADGERPQGNQWDRLTRGQLHSIDGTTLVLVVGEAGREVRTATEADTKYSVDGKPAKLADLKPGMFVSVHQKEGLTVIVEARSPGGRVKDGDRPRGEGDRPRAEGDRPREGAAVRDGDKPREGAAVRDGDRPREGTAIREGDRPREGAGVRDGDRPREGAAVREGDRPRVDGDRRRVDGDRPREGAVAREGERPREGAVAREGERPREGAVREGERPNRDGEPRRGEIRLRVLNMAGRIQSIEDGKIALNSERNAERVVPTDAKTHVWIDGKASDVGDLKPGMYIQSRQVEGVTTEIDARSAR